jgi:hypothetical protein
MTLAVYGKLGAPGFKRNSNARARMLISESSAIRTMSPRIALETSPRD